MKQIFIFFIFFITLFLSSCEPKPIYAIITIKSDTEWTTFVEGRTIDGKGDKDINVQYGSYDCYLITKKTKVGTLAAQVQDYDSYGQHNGESKTTIAEYGSVQVCHNSNFNRER